MGGMGQIVGIEIEEIVMIGGKEIMSEMRLMKIILGKEFKKEIYRMLILGIEMVVVMVWKKSGLVGRSEKRELMNERKMV